MSSEKKWDEMFRTEQLSHMRGLQDEVIKAQLVAAVRLDVIRLLGFIMNRDPAPEIDSIVPKEPQVRAVMAHELMSLATHLRERADGFTSQAKKMLSGSKSKEDSSNG